MDLEFHPATAYPPDFEPMESSIKWKNNFRGDVIKGTANNFAYEPINKIVTIPLGDHTIEYLPSHRINTLHSGENTISQDIIVNEIV